MQQRIEKIFWTLLRSGLSECESNLIGYGELDDSDWQLLYALAKRQGVIGILFSAIEKMPKSQLPRKELLMKWFGMVEYIKKKRCAISTRASFLQNVSLHNISNG